MAHWRRLHVGQRGSVRCCLLRSVAQDAADMVNAQRECAAKEQLKIRTRTEWGGKKEKERGGAPTLHVFQCQSTTKREHKTCHSNMKKRRRTHTQT